MGFKSKHSFFDFALTFMIGNFLKIKR